jgi:uncharacterized protein
MSHENVQLVRAIWKAWNAGDMDTVRALYDPDVIVRTPEDWPERGPWVGREAVMRAWQQQRETFDADELILVDHSRDVGDLVAFRFIWRGTGRGPEADMDLSCVAMTRKGRMCYQEFFWNYAEALETLGLSEQAMSQENVEIVRRIYDAVARRDVVTPFESYAEDIVWDISNWRVVGMGLKPVYRGHEGVRECWREILSVFGEVDFEVEKLIDAGDQVLAVIREREIGRASGVPVETTHLAVWRLTDGKVAQMQIFDDRQQALEAAGLSEQDAHAEPT